MMQSVSKEEEGVKAVSSGRIGGFVDVASYILPRSPQRRGSQSVKVALQPRPQINAHQARKFWREGQILGIDKSPRIFASVLTLVRCVGASKALAS